MKKYIRSARTSSETYTGRYSDDIFDLTFAGVPQDIIDRTIENIEVYHMGLYDSFAEACRELAPKGSELYKAWYYDDFRLFIPNAYDEKYLDFKKYPLKYDNSIESSTDICADSNGGSVRIHLNTDICPIIIPDTYGTEFQYEVDEDMWDEFKQLMMDKAYDYIKEALDDIGIPYSNLTVDKFESPQFYNYSTDWIDFSFDVPSNIVEIMESEIDDTFFDYTENKFGSHPGFISSMPYTKAEFIESDDLDRKVAMYVMYKFSQAFDPDIYEREYLYSVYDDASENGYLIDDYDE